MKYKTPAAVRVRLKERRDAIKAAGGTAYTELLAKERINRAEYRRRHPEKVRERERQKDRKKYSKSRQLMKIRRRAKKLGAEMTVRVADLEWPTHCPVLGIELDYTPRHGSRNCRNPANPSLDRWDNAKGYVPGNVFVISFRANILKNNATAEELEAVARYARHGCVALSRSSG